MSRTNSRTKLTNIRIPHNLLKELEKSRLKSKLTNSAYEPLSNKSQFLLLIISYGLQAFRIHRGIK